MLSTLLSWVLLAGVAILVWVAMRGPRNGKARTPTPRNRIPRIRGPAKYAVEVVGESFHAESFAALKRDLRPDDLEEEWVGDAMLSLEDKNEHDPNAVAVHINSRHVGHLNRANARDFRQAIKRDGLSRFRQFAVGARLYWGGEEKMHSVSVDLPESV